MVTVKMKLMVIPIIWALFNFFIVLNISFWLKRMRVINSAVNVISIMFFKNSPHNGKIYCYVVVCRGFSLEYNLRPMDQPRAIAHTEILVVIHLLSIGRKTSTRILIKATKTPVNNAVFKLLSIRFTPSYGVAFQSNLFHRIDDVFCVN